MITKVVSSIAGALAKTPLPPLIRTQVLSFLADVLRIDLSKASKPVSSYPTFQDLFIRKLRVEFLPQPGSSEFISPCCGTFNSSGPIGAFTFLPVKGHTYTIEELIGKKPDPSYETGAFLYLYLSPKDYHRVHVPISATLKGYWSVPGYLFPVNSFGIRFFKKLFAVNEKLVFEFESAKGNYCLVMVGALNVGNMKVSPDIKALPTELRSGEELGIFNLGSTVVMLLDEKLSKKYSSPIGAETMPRDVWVGESL